MLNGFEALFLKPRLTSKFLRPWEWYMHSLSDMCIVYWQMELLFDAYAEQGRMILVNTQNNEQCESGASSPCKSLQPHDPSETPRAIYGECFSSPPLL